MRKNRIAILAALAAIFICSTARAQGVRYDNVVLGPRGVPTGAANVEVFPATGSGVAQISSASETGYVVTVTTAAAHGFTAGQTVSIADSGVSGYNGLFTIVSVPTSTTFVYQAGSTGLAASAGGVAAVTPATIYSDWALTSPIANPTTSDSLGNYGFWAAPGHYIIQISGSPYIAKTMDVFLSCDASSTTACGSSAGTTSGSGGPGSSCTIAGSFYVQTGGTPTVYLCTVVNGNLTWVQQSGTVTLTTTPPTSCTAGTWTYDTDTGQLWLGSSTNTCTLMQGGTGIAGTENYLAKFALPNAVGNSTLYENPFPELTTQGFSLALQPLLVAYTNNASGTTLGLLVKYNNGTGDVSTVATTDTNDAIGVVYSGAGTSGTVQVAQGGTVNCVFDGATTKGDYVQISPTAAGDCHDAGATYPTSGEVLGHVNSTNAAGGTYAMNIFSPDVGGTATVCKGKTGCGGGAGGTVTSVGISGNGVTVAATTSGGPITSSGVINLPVPTVPAGYIPQGPVPTTGTNITMVGTPTNCSASPCQINHPITATSGEELYVVMGPYSGACTVADTLGNVFTQETFVSNTVAAYAPVTVGGTDSITATVHCLDGNTHPTIKVLELANVAAHDAANNNCANISGSCSVTTTAPGDIIFAIAINTQVSANTFTVSPSVVQLDQMDGLPASYVGSYGASTGTTYTFTVSSTSGTYWYLDSFKEGAGAGGGPLTLGPITEAMLPRSAVSQVQAEYVCTQGADVAYSTANSATSLITCNVTMPTEGGPFRVLVSTNTYAISTASGGTTINTWVSDGTNAFCPSQGSLATTLAGGQQGTCLSTVSYPNGQAVTFTLYGASSSNLATAKYLPANTVTTQPASLKVVVMQSAN